VTPDTPEPIKIPYLDDDEIRARAEEWLAEAHPSGAIPIPIELIVERQGIDIVPLPGLRSVSGFEGATSSDCRTIFVDADRSEKYERRYRFTLAHEVAHVVLHRDLFSSVASVSSKEEWIAANQRLTDATGGSVEYQANCFAGLVLVPPAHLDAVVARILPDVKAMIQ